MISDALSVDQYFSGLPDDKRELLTEFRKLCIATLKGYEECMEYRMPCYKKNGQVEVAFANQKNYISLYILKHAVVKKNSALLDKKSVGKSCIKFSNPKKIDFDVVKKLLEDTVTINEDICPR